MHWTRLLQTALKGVSALFFEKSYEISQKQSECKVFGQNTGKHVEQIQKNTGKSRLYQRLVSLKFV